MCNSSEDPNISHFSLDFVKKYSKKVAVVIKKAFMNHSINFTACLIMQKRMMKILKELLGNLGLVSSHSQRKKQQNLQKLDPKKVQLCLRKFLSNLLLKRTELVKSKINRQKWKRSQNIPTVVLTVPKALKNLVI